MILILYTIRFIKFLEMKKFLFENEDIYKNESYFPNKIFNRDNFPLAISINMFLFNLLYIFYKNEIERENSYVPKEKFIIISIIPFFTAFFILGLFDLTNDLTIAKTFDNLIYNWKMNPIKNIRLNQETESKNILQWRNDIFEIERIDNLDYINIFQTNNSKLCGKDNFGNNLYFPKELDCPINKIFISESSNDLQNYTKLKLNSGKYLYFTNQFFEGKIVNDLRINSDSEISLKADRGFYPNFITFPFYEEIDSDKNNHLYYFNYLGINISSFSENKIYLIKNFEDKIGLYKFLSKAKIILYSIKICYFLVIIFLIFFYKLNFDQLNSFLENTSYFRLIIIDLFILIKIIYYIILIICFFIH